MRSSGWTVFEFVAACSLALISVSATPVGAQPYYAAEELVQAGGTNIAVGGYSVPSFVFWDNDDLPDLIVGEGSGTVTPKVRVYLNVGSAAAPAFAGFNYAQANGADLTVPGSGCLGLFPRVLYWDADARKDLLIGRADGKIALFLNNATDADPAFDGGRLLQVGPVGGKTNIDVGDRATPIYVDWDNDGLRDLIVGALDGKLHLFLNEGTDTEPDFITQTFVQNGGTDLTVTSGRSSPVMVDFDGDGRKDVLAGNTNGQVVYYANVGTDAAPAFADYVYFEVAGVPLDLASTPRSRPSSCDWTGDGFLDLLVGAGDGKVRLYQGGYHPGDLDEDGDVDLDDYVVLAECMYGPGVAPPTCSEYSDIDGDGDMDLVDFALLSSALSE